MNATKAGLTLVNDRERLQVVCCGEIDKRYGEALYGTFHATENGIRTLCGCRCSERETKSTLWMRADPMHDAQDVSCNRCRKSLGLEPIRDSRVML